jgi:predicted Rossmann fold flavoprotein
LQPSPTITDIVIIGAGAAGLMAAITAGQRGRRVLLLDHADEPGKKILISGGGRCNFTNLHTAPNRFFGTNHRFPTSALSRYTPQHFLALIEKHRIPWHEKTLGQLFCDGSARAIVAMLLAEAEAAGVIIRLNTTIGAISKPDQFHLDTSTGPVRAESLILATGGLSIPKLGASDFAHRVARQFALPVIAPRPALVPVTLGDPILSLTQPLAGVSLPVRAKAGKIAFDEALLFTHRGLSGPAILQISTPWQPGGTIMLDLLPNSPPDFLRRAKQASPKLALRTALSETMPHRLATALAPAAIAAAPLTTLPDRTLNALAQSLKAWPITPTGTEGYAKAEVTSGGIDTNALSSQTLQARAVPGLFAIGEAVDVTGWLGGYNFQWAWASGVAAGYAA